MSARDLGHMLYQIVLMLEVIRHYDEKYAKQYASDTYRYAGFPGMKPAMTDMYNLISAINNQKDLEEYLDVDHTVSAPEFGIKRYLRDIIEGHRYIQRDREFFVKLEDYLKITDGDLKNVRRLVSYWDTYSDTVKKTAIVNLRRNVRADTPYIDVYWYKFKDLA